MTWLRITIGFLAISYGLGAPWTAFLEYRDATLSQRFGYTPAFIYAICAVQFVGAIAMLMHRLVAWAAAVFTVITLGAIVSHPRIGSPVTAVPAVIYTAVQVWCGVAAVRMNRGGGADES